MAAQFVSYPVANPEDRFSRDKAHIKDNEVSDVQLESNTGQCYTQNSVAMIHVIKRLFKMFYTDGFRQKCSELD